MGSEMCIRDRSNHLHGDLLDLEFIKEFSPILILMWSCDQALPAFLPIFAPSSPCDSIMDRTALIAAILSIASSVISKPHSGIFPCFLAGLNSSLSSNISSALANFERV